MRIILLCLLLVVHPAAGEEIAQGDRMLAEYFESEVAEIETSALDGLETEGDWDAWKTARRGELFSMLGLDPERERTALKPVVTRTLGRGGIVVENLHFQSSPGLYVTGNLYRPAKVEERLPAVLYVCGHGGVKMDGVSYGNKVHYHHHGAWFARNGYVCLTIDTLQLGEIEGMHHGTYRYGRWDWVCRGYSPAGVEAWNSIRALDYLETRAEVDGGRMGVTGRSGGGAYSWYLAALDDRIKVAVPVAGITSLRDHVVGRCVDGHCDCMYMVNSARWDFSTLAALVAPRPLLIENTDKDRIFPLGGVMDVYNKARGVYKLLGAEDRVGICVTEGGHQDTQELRVPAFRWFERFLKGADPVGMVRDQAVPVFEPEELRVFTDGLPADEVNTVIGDRFTELAGGTGKAELRHLRDEVFGGWPEEGAELKMELLDDFADEEVRIRSWAFTSEEPWRLRMWLLQRKEDERLDEVELRVLDEEAGKGFLERVNGELVGRLKEGGGIAFVAPRGVGPTAWGASGKRDHQVRRSFVLLGQTVDGMRVWDTRRAARALRSIGGMDEVRLTLSGSGDMAGAVLYASLFEEGVAGVKMEDAPRSHRDGMTLINVLRLWDFPDAVSAAEVKGVKVKGVKVEGGGE